MKKGPTPWQIVQRFSTEYLAKESKQQLVFVDVGARIGQWTQLGVSHRWKTIAIEASKASYNGLCEKYKNTPNVEVLNFAISDENKDGVKFFVSADEPGRCSLDCNDDVLSENYFEYVNMRTIKTILDERNLAANIIKTDIEGADLLALRGIGLADLNRRPEIIVSEVSGRCRDFGYTTRDMVAEMNSYDYECFIVVTRVQSNKAASEYFGDYEGSLKINLPRTNRDAVFVRKEQLHSFRDFFHS